MKSIKRCGVAALVVMALSACANTPRNAPVAEQEAVQPRAVATSAADTPHVTRVEDVIKGAILTGGLGGGIKLAGFWQSAPLPLPPGKWEVVERKNFSRTWKTAPTKPTLRFLWVALKNQDPEAQVQWLDFSSNITTDRVGYIHEVCAGNYEILNDFGTTKSGFMERCGYAAYVEDHRPPLEFMGPPLQEPDIQAPNLLTVQLHAGYSGGRLTNWRIYVVPPAALQSAEQRKEAVARFLQETGDQIKEFLNNRPALLPDRLALPP